MALAFIMKWDPSIHGISDNEKDLINYFKTKYLLMELVWGDGENSFDSDMSLEDNIDWLNRYHDNPDIPNEHLKLVPIKKMYRYKERDFAIVNYGLEKFQKRYKKYFAAKMKHFKNTRNICHRQIYGKYPIFKPTF
tara:strand:+ start:595 stop:1002 length:408 start_codon:yes stop_codon:yes gene_type:complete